MSIIIQLSNPIKRLKSFIRPPLQQSGWLDIRKRQWGLANKEESLDDEWVALSPGFAISLLRDLDQLLLISLYWNKPQSYSHLCKRAPLFCIIVTATICWGSSSHMQAVICNQQY